MTSLATLTRLLHLASPALPVGAYSYSQGLEWAVESGMITDGASAQRWILDGLQYVVGQFEAPLWLQLYAAWSQNDRTVVGELNQLFIATRESAELRAETLQMGYSLLRLLDDLQDPDLVSLVQAVKALSEVPQEIAFVTVFSAVCAHWHIEAAAGLAAYLFAWVENQVAAALKAVPLGQVAGQKIMLAAHPIVQQVTEAAVKRLEHAATSSGWSTWAPGLAIASAQHETQYSRLFRS